MAPINSATHASLGPLQAELGQQAGRLVLRITAATSRSHGFKPILDRLFRSALPHIDPNRLHTQYECHPDRPVLVFFDKADLLATPQSAQPSFLAEVFAYLLSEGLITRPQKSSSKMSSCFAFARRITQNNQGQWALSLSS